MFFFVLLQGQAKTISGPSGAASKGQGPGAAVQLAADKTMCLQVCYNPRPFSPKLIAFKSLNPKNLETLFKEQKYYSCSRYFYLCSHTRKIQGELSAKTKCRASILRPTIFFSQLSKIICFLFQRKWTKFTILITDLGYRNLFIQQKYWTNIRLFFILESKYLRIICQKLF